ncbi:MAG TPA: hypothetical protein VG672_16150 [Bryobacteraceae bacterium]|nr:hypothetical protein [Bryobacteraceae bacterium]
MSEAAYRRMLLAGALWNLAGGTFVILATPWIFSQAGLVVPKPGVYYWSWIALFMTFGLGYYLAYRDMYRNRDIIRLGAIGKFAFAVIFLYGYYANPGEIPPFFLIPVIGDLVFVVLFIMFLRFARKQGYQ